jgi:hypothetical protein
MGLLLSCFSGSLLLWACMCRVAETSCFSGIYLCSPYIRAVFISSIYMHLIFVTELYCYVPNKNAPSGFFVYLGVRLLAFTYFVPHDVRRLLFSSAFVGVGSLHFPKDFQVCLHERRE